MNRLRLIIDLEQQLNRKFKEVDIIEMTNWRFNETLEYSLNQNGEIKELLMSNIDLSKKKLDFKNCKYLEVLNLGVTKISEISFVRNLENLRRLNLEYNKIENIVSLKGLTQLRRLKLEHNKITDISSLKGLINLIELNLNLNNINNINALANLNNLKELKLSSNNIRDISALKNIKKVTLLHLSSNPIGNINVLIFLTKLTELSLSGKFNNIDSLKSLAGLTKLVISYSQVSDISALEELEELEELWFAKSRIEDITALKNLHNLQSLCLKGNQIIDITSLKGYENLTSLDLSYNPIQILPEWICEFQGLEICWHSSFLASINSIRFFNNPIKNVPIEVLKKGKSDVKIWFSALNEYKVKYQYKIENLTKNIKSMENNSIFISYSHHPDDMKYFVELKEHLGTLPFLGLDVPIWDDTLIKSGDDWFNEIKKALNSTRIGILLVSQNFLSSKFINEEEITTLLENVEKRGGKVIPILLRKTLFHKHPALGKYQAVNSPKKPLNALSETEKDDVYTKLLEDILEFYNK